MSDILHLTLSDFTFGCTCPFSQTHMVSNKQNMRFMNKWEGLIRMIGCYPQWWVSDIQPQQNHKPNDGGFWIVLGNLFLDARWDILDPTRPTSQKKWWDLKNCRDQPQASSLAFPFVWFPSHVLLVFSYYPLVMTNSSPWYRWPIEIDGLPIKNGWIFPWLC